MLVQCKLVCLDPPIHPVDAKLLIQAALSPQQLLLSSHHPPTDYFDFYLSDFSDAFVNTWFRLAVAVRRAMVTPESNLPSTANHPHMTATVY